jgi:hypothetical protein
LHLQLFLALQPLSLLLHPPCPLQSFLPLQACFVVSWSIALLANDALPTFTTDVALVDEAAACIVAAPPSMPDTAAATIKVFIECFIRCHSSMIF